METLNKGLTSNASPVAPLTSNDKIMRIYYGFYLNLFSCERGKLMLVCANNYFNNPHRKFERLLLESMAESFTENDNCLIEEYDFMKALFNHVKSTEHFAELLLKPFGDGRKHYLMHLDYNRKIADFINNGIKDTIIEME